MGSTQVTFIEPVLPLVLGRFLGCGKDNEHSAYRIANYQKKSFKLTSFCTICCFKLREDKKRAAALERPDVEAMATRVKDAETMTEAAPIAEEAEKIAAIRAEEARFKVEE